MSNIVEKEIDGVIYRAQFRGMAYASDISDEIDEEASNLRTSEKLFREILISPQIGIDDFSDINSYRKVHSFLLDVALGKFPAKRKSRAQLKRRARENWALWRLVLSQRGFDYPTVFGKPFMTPQDVMEANIALDMQIEAERKAAKKKK